jgi:hypothetical protein
MNGCLSVKTGSMAVKFAGSELICDIVPVFVTLETDIVNYFCETDAATI